jgi:CubicO group peptidase (beta-lactamase class C family)
MRSLIFAAVCLGTAATQAAAEDFSRDARVLAAGYKAAFTCSGLFNGARSLESIAAGELARIYPDYRPVLAALPDASIDREAKTVAVSFAADMPPRIAHWRPHLGCTQLPPGAAVETTALLPRLDGLAKLPPPSSAPWPAGEGDARDRTPALLAEVLAGAFDGATYGEGTATTAVLVVQGGRIVAERYAEGFDARTPQRTWSVAKSMTATIIGAAVQQGLVDVDAPAPVPEWSSPGDPRGRITLENLLHMTSGLDSGIAGHRTDRIYFGGGLVADNASSKSLEATPGSRWKYANIDTLNALRALRAAMGDDEAFLRFPFEYVLHPLGMRRTFLETDWNGDFIGSSQVWTTARDLARIGLLHLRDGVWEGKRILPEGWVTYVRTPGPAQPGGASPYGAQWWLSANDALLPNDAFTALGSRGQAMVIVPSADIIVVRRGLDDVGGTAFAASRFAADILAALSR